MIRNKVASSLFFAFIIFSSEIVVAEMHVSLSGRAEIDKYARNGEVRVHNWVTAKVGEGSGFRHSKKELEKDSAQAKEDQGTLIEALKQK